MIHCTLNDSSCDNNLQIDKFGMTMLYYIGIL